MDAPQEQPPISPLLVIFIGILAASTSSILVRFAQEEAGSLVIAAYRLTIASLILTPIALRRRGELRALTRGELRLGLLSGLFLTAHFATWISSLEYTTVASSIVLVSTTPLWVGLLAPLTLREAISRPVLFGMLVTLVGGTIVGLSDSCTLIGTELSCPPLAEFVQGEAFFGDLLALAGAWAGAGYILIGRRLRNQMSLITYIYVVYGIAALALVGLMLGAGNEPFGYPPRAYVLFLLLALLPQLLGHSSFNWALRYLPAAYVSITLLGEPIGTTILALLILGEVPTPLKLFGAILILAGIYIASQREREPQPAASET